ncbi:hypothetical protein L6452_13744 [Arctium lappa]|uniref:Uncharacterized protein n=1 Tax=Arctium lappa TaxID=4217 RepID=A0ACB9CIZ6_ARCLA|nr:hypothetical protein L6452_13744 [Arctium lappa]
MSRDLTSMKSSSTRSVDCCYKAERLLADAASYGSELVVFPEAFVGGYPRGSNFGVSIGKRTLKGKEDFRKYHDATINVPGKTMHLMLHWEAQEAHANGLVFCFYAYVLQKIWLLSKEDESQQHEGTRMPDCRATSALIKFGAVIGLGLQIHLKTKIRIGGVDCNKCGSVFGAFFQNSYSGVKVVPAKSANRRA